MRFRAVKHKMFKSTKTRILSDRDHGGDAIVVSFYGGDPYYERCATRLAEQCEALGISHDICEYIPADAEGWINICRKKIDFYTGKSEQYDRPVVWVDVDSKIIADPRPVLRSNADLGAFLRNFKYLVGFDPLRYSRLLHPGYILLGRSERARAFIGTLREVDRTGDPAGTDDYVLQEALLGHAHNLSIELFPPSYIVSSNESRNRAEAIFQHGDSGNVGLNVAAATQHEAVLLTPERRKRVFLDTAEGHLREKRPRDAEPLLRELLRLDPGDATIVVRLLKLYAKLGWEKKHAALIRRSAAKPELARAVLRHRYEVAAGKEDLDLAAELAREMEALGETAGNPADNAADRAFVQSRQFRLSFDEEARARGIEDAERVAMWWWERPFPGNLGDMINPWLVGKLTGIPPKFAARGERVIAIGSIIRFARAGDKVWGAGCPSADQVIEPEAVFHAVRGPLTRRMVLDAGGECPPVYGDPAWLLPLVHPDRGLPRTSRVGLIRHFTHRDRPMELGEGVREIEIVRNGRAGIEAFLDEMLDCEAIVSTSLHGLIIANAYGIPARLATFDDGDRQIHGDGTKFEDYFLSIGLREVAPLNLATIGRLDAGLAAACDDNPVQRIDLQALLDAAPFPILPEVHEELKRLRAGATTWGRIAGLTRRALGAARSSRG